MDINYLGHSAFKIKFKSATLVCDPFDSEMLGFKFPAVEADIVTVSHSHKDHNNISAVKNYKKVVEGPGEYEIMGVSIIGIPSYHDQKKGAERGKNTIYIFESEGLRVAHLGDLGHTLSDNEIEEVGEINILMIPTGGTVNLNPEEASEVVRAIEPNITIPMHYQEEGLNPEMFSKLVPVESFLKEVGLPVERLPKLSLKLSELQEEQKVVVLERK